APNPAGGDDPPRTPAIIFAKLVYNGMPLTPAKIFAKLYFSDTLNKIDMIGRILQIP
ncbi:MAG: hypothetical protein HW380_2625, partial [Magnetococcales bacterium]|nr:hypothetical protein [Magnetococcales bacterium]